MDLHLLSVSNNRLTDLPKEIGQMKTLKSLVSKVIVFFYAYYYYYIEYKKYV